ncbi:hypothetical protein CsatA_028972 [Cannabis sativa]
MSLDIKKTENDTQNVRYQVLRSISSTIESMGKDINSYQLLDEDIIFDNDEFQSREINDELNVEIPEEDPYDLMVPWHLQLLHQVWQHLFFREVVQLTHVSSFPSMPMEKAHAV